MNIPKSKCIHIHTVGDYTKEDIIEKQDSLCDTCHKEGPYLWVCLHRDCLYVGCNESGSNHCVKHFQKYTDHSLFLNLTSLRVYCLLCDCEVFLENNDPPLPGMLPTHPLIANKPDTDSEDDAENEENVKPRGLTGLQNLGNTCYMNSAIQALSNCPQLTNFFLECGPFVRSEKKPGLSKSYMRLMKEMWHKKRFSIIMNKFLNIHLQGEATDSHTPIRLDFISCVGYANICRPSYVVPSGIAYGIKIVCPVFRGYTQQDAQEFLRCFMDQLHEELKEPIVEIAPILRTNLDIRDDLDNARADSGIPASEDSSQSDADYETCDSGLSSEKASCADEGVDSHENHTDSTDLVGVVSFDTAHLSLKQTKSFHTSLPSIHCSTISSHVEDLNIPSNENSSLTKHENCLNTNYCDFSLISKNKDVCDANRNEPFPNEKEEIIPVNHLGDTLWNKDSCVRRGSQLKQVNPDTIMAILNARKKNMHYRSIVSDIFDGKILSSVQCLTCDTISTTKETFQDLSLPIPNKDHLHMIHTSQGNHKNSGTCTDVYSHQGWFSAFFGWVLSWFWGPSVNLQDCLSAFFSADELKGDNMYSCEKCKKLRNGIKYSKVIELPEVLCIHLKRFRHEVMFSSKINNYVAFPLEGLDMSPFLHKSYPAGVTTYDLSSVICHHGTAGSGHYTSYSLNYLNDQWYEFDDQYVTAVDAEMVRHCEAYVLFYRKCGDEMIKKRQCAVKLMERCQSELGLLKFHISKQWINKFNNFAEPGPITNTDFLCCHGGVPPQKADFADELCTVLPQAVWEYLHDTFGGGPPCTHLYICPICQAELHCLNQKRGTELEDFTNMNTDFQHLESPSVVYAISTNWFKTWENFVCREGDIPGPIDNNSICCMKNNQAALKLGSDYCSLSKEMFQYLQNIYGGGPEIILQPNIKASSLSCPQFSSQMNRMPRTKSLFTSSNSAQKAQVHVSSQGIQSSQNQPINCSFTSKTTCDLESHQNLVSTETKNAANSEANLCSTVKSANA